jgi:predicted secreted protein
VAFAGSAASCHPAPASEAARTVHAKIGETFEVRLPAQLGTGFSWSLDKADPTLRPVGSPALGSAATPGQAQDQVFAFRAAKSGAFKLHFTYEQPWKGGQKNARSQDVTVVVSGS